MPAYEGSLKQVLEILDILHEVQETQSNLMLHKFASLLQEKGYIPNAISDDEVRDLLAGIVAALYFVQWGHDVLSFVLSPSSDIRQLEKVVRKTTPRPINKAVLEGSLHGFTI